jgi:hypothetical protein
MIYLHGIVVGVGAWFIAKTVTEWGLSIGKRISSFWLFCIGLLWGLVYTLLLAGIMEKVFISIIDLLNWLTGH